MIVNIRVQLLDGRTSELHRVSLGQGPLTSLSEFVTLAQSSFKRHLRGRELQPNFTYFDDDGNLIAVDTDAEVPQAWDVRSKTYSFAIADLDEGWQLVDHNLCAVSEELVTWTTRIQFWLNGKEQIIDNPSPSLLLANWLREKKGAMGTKIGCAEGGCGICTVAMAFEDSSGQMKTVSINSCLRRVCALDGVHIVTTEGIGSQKEGFHPVQKAIADGNGSQCGYCTPGWVMNMYALLQKSNAELTREDIEQNFDGNLCRCTGYRPILNAFGEFSKDGKLCCHRQSIGHPAEILGRRPQPLHFSDPTTSEEWYRPLTLAHLNMIRKAISGKKLRLLCANTSAGVVKYFSPMECIDESGTVFVDITKIPELTGIRFDTKAGITFGASVPFTDVLAELEKHTSQVPHFGAIAEHIKRVASVQIRNVGSWAGNLMLTREYPVFASDAALVFATAGASIAILDSQGTEQDVTVAELLDPRGTPGDITVLALKIPIPPVASILRTYKTAARHVFAHAIVNFGAFFAFDASRRVTEARIVVHGATKALLMANKTAACLVGQLLDKETFSRATGTLAREIAENPSTDERHSSTFRMNLVRGFLYKSFLASHNALPDNLRSTQEPFIPADGRPVSSGTESFGVDNSESPISQFIPKLNARKQASGEAMYTSDAGRMCLFAQIVYSTTAKAKLITLDPAVALKMPGVVDFISAADVPGLNLVCMIESQAEKAFFQVGDTIPCVGCVLGVIVADTWMHARQAAKAVTQRYINAQRVVTSMQEAEQLGRVPTQEDVDKTAELQENPVFRRQMRLSDRHPCPLTAVGGGEDTQPRAEATQTLKSTISMGWQNAFPMETQAVLVTPIDGDGFEVIASTQSQSLVQMTISAILNTPMHKITVKTYQVGGAFGAKAFRNCIVSQACAVAAHKLNVPVYLQNERSDDMQMMPAGRASLGFRYTVTFEPTGKVDTMDATMIYGPGWFLGLGGDLLLAKNAADSCYYYRKFNIGPPKTLLTDIPHTTFTRAPGTLNAGCFAQSVMEHIAKSIGKSTEEVMEMNFYSVGDQTLSGDEIGKDGYSFTVPLMWKKIQADTKYAQRKAAVGEYNLKNRWTKKGIALAPVQYAAEAYSIGYALHAIICVYPDGSVLISHGGIEMGQGLNTKAMLVAAETLGIPTENIEISPTDTSKLPNEGMTAGSLTSESICYVVIKACETLKDRLKPYTVDKGMSWDDAVQAASIANVNLMAVAYNTWEAKKDGNANPYAVNGVAASEVLVDVLTGEVRVERIDILMDLGTQLDAAVDLGQVQGAFVMALGWMLTEELRWNAQGTVLNLGTWEYKPPTAYDIPVKFNVSLLKDAPNQSPVSVKGSKMSAEPPMLLVAAVMLAVKEALYASRKDNGLGDDWFQLDVPLTPENVRNHCGAAVHNFIFPAV